MGERPIPAGDGRSVRLQRDYDAPIEDVWDALTNPERIGRWFLPISGDYRLGGRYQFEGNAGGEIVACERPNRLKVTWVYGEVDERRRRLGGRGPAVGRRRGRDPVRDGAHRGRARGDVGASTGRAPSASAGTGGLLGLALHLRGGSIVDDPAAWQLSEEGRDFTTRSSEAWGEANRAAGADPEAVARGVADTTAFYAGIPAPETVA